MFHNKRLPLSCMALAVSSAYAQAPEAPMTISITGIRASAQSSLALKKNAAEVVDAITAEDIGKLPDPNVAETLTRVPGVQGYRYGGEGASPVGNGSGLTIRGLSGLTASQVNGRSYFTAGSREFNIEGAIPGMVAALEVYKNPSADHIEGGIGGLVNVRTRKPSDFKKPTFTLSSTAKYNDLAGKIDPELFALAANSWSLGGERRFGLLAAGVFQKSTGRSDNNPANGGPNFKRAIRADSAEYATLAAANTGNSAAQAQSAYVGRTDVYFLASVPSQSTSSTVGANMPNTTGLTASQIGDVMVAPTLTNNVFQETIMRTRRGLSLAADYVHSATLRTYAEFDYTYYQYHQNYRGLNSVDGGNVTNLQTTPFAYTEGLANRNFNGGSDDVLVSKRLQSASFLNSTVTTTGGDEHRPYTTSILATGVDWKASPQLNLKGDLNLIKATQTQDNRSVNMASAAGLSWTTHRVADGSPHSLNFSGPNLSDPANFVFNNFANGTHQKWKDDGGALAVSGDYSPEMDFLTKVKFGARLARQNSNYNSYNFSGKNLTTNGAALAANQSNAISGSSKANLIELAPGNFMDGQTGYSGGFVAYAPDALLDGQVGATFPLAGIPSYAALPEVTSARRLFREKTQAVYAVAEFLALGDKLTGNVGLRLVRTQSTATARVQNLVTNTEVDNPVSTTYTNALPSLNLLLELDKGLQARFGYGRGLTRPALDALNPTVSVSTTTGTGTVGNASLKPQVADSIDLSLERYFNATNYVAVGVFNKDISGFFSGINECMTVATAPLYTGTASNGCSNGQYLVTRNVNALKGYARGLELSGQYFFDKNGGPLANFGVAASYTYVDTKNPVNFGTAAAPRIIDTQQPFASKHSMSLTGLYEANAASARVVYTWRSDQVLFGASANPIDGRYIAAFGILDASFNYNLTKELTLSLTGSNLLNQGLNRNVGEPGAYATSLERQHFMNGRFFAVGLRYKFD